MDRAPLQTVIDDDHGDDLPPTVSETELVTSLNVARAEVRAGLWTEAEAFLEELRLAEMALSVEITENT